MDFFRTPSEKDASGWHGPATVTAVYNDRGMLEVEYRRERPMRVKFGDVRRFMDFNALVFGTVSQTLIHTIERAINSQAVGCIEDYGYRYQISESRWILTHAARRSRTVALALQHIATNILNFTELFGVRIGHGISRLVPHADATHT